MWYKVNTHVCRAVLARAGAHMEHSMVGAYVALLLGHVARARAAAVRARVPTYAPLLPTLKKYYAFLALTASVSTTRSYYAT